MKKQSIEELKELAMTALSFDKDKIVDADLSWYKLDKHSGYSIILLWKGMIKVEVVGCWSDRGNEIEAKYPETPRWNNQPVHNYLRVWAESKGLTLFDGRYRRSTEYTVAVKRHIEELKAEAGK